MGTANIPSATDGTPIPASDHNSIIAALKDDLVPRNASGNATANAGRMGTDDYPWKSAKITTGYLFPGQVIMFHDFNADLTPGQGWMKCNGDIVNETNYDAIHGAGSWDEYIVTSLLDGKNLPNMNDKFPVGATNTSQDGSGAITFEGNASHQVNLAHTHTGPSHNHQWYEVVATGNPSKTFNSSGTLEELDNSGADGGWHLVTNADNDALHSKDAYTSNAGTGNTGSGGSATQNIKPESCAFEFWIRII